MALKRLRYGSSSYSKKRSRTVGIRRKYRARKTSRRLQRTSLGSSIGFPKMLKFKHKYATNTTLQSTGGLAHYQFRANGMYDPDVTSTGHQPMYFDQVSALYDHYVVIGSRIKYTIVPKGTTVQAPYKITTWINDDTTTTGASDILAENKFAKTRICQGGVNPDKIILYNKWSAKKFFGGSVLSDDQLKGTPSSDPAEQSIFQLSLTALDGVSTIDVHLFVEVEYVAVWKELKELVSS